MNFKEFYFAENRNYPTDEELYNKYKDQDVYYSYRSIDKLGINPKSKYDTPNGIYAYPVKYQDPDVKFTGESESGFVYFFKLKPGTKLLNLNTYREKDKESDLDKLKKAGYNIDLDFSDALKSTSPGELWFALYKNAKNSNHWNSLIRKVLGYDAVLDTGAGIIHSHEPKQIVVLNPTSIEILEKGMFDKRLDWEKISLTDIKKENELKVVNAFIDKLKKKEPDKKVIGEGLLNKILHQLHPSNIQPFLEKYMNDIILKGLAIFDSYMGDFDTDTSKKIIILMEPIVDRILNTDPNQIAYFPKEYQMELIKKYKDSFPDYYTTLYAVSKVKTMDDKLEFMKLFPKYVLKELESEPKTVFNYFKTDKVYTEYMLKLIDIFKNSIRKFGKLSKEEIIDYLQRYLDKKNIESVKETIGLE